MELWTGAVILGCLYSLMALGVYFTYRIFNFPDITVDGSFTTGASVVAVVLISGGNPYLAILLAFIAGSLAGLATAIIHTELKVNGLLAGILVMTGLYSINLHIMGRSNIPLLRETSVFSHIEAINPGLSSEIWLLLILLIVMVVVWILASLFLKTDIGIAMRVTGNNATMAAANGINVNRMIWFGVAISNGLVGVSGALVAQYQGFADIGVGIGTIVAGLAAVIIGESLIKKPSIYSRVISVIAGSVVFRLMIAVALYVGMNPIDLKVITALFVLLTLFVARNPLSALNRRKSLPSYIRILTTRKGFSITITSIFTILVLIYSIRNYYDSSEDDEVYKIGLVQVLDHALLNTTRDALVHELFDMGYVEGENIFIDLKDANGDLSMVNSIIDKFLLDDVDIIVTVSTPCTQAAIKKVTDRPVIFATVANPFILGAGESDSVHMSNVTGVYGWVPMDKMLELAKDIVPGKIRIGSIWDPAQANAVFNVDQLKDAVDNDPDVIFYGATVTGSSEVYQAATSLVNKGIDAFVLATDNVVYSAFESIVKASLTRNIPVFMSDVDRLKDGAIATYGYDYAISGIQAAHLVHRVLSGEDPATIPFERYKKITIGLNQEVADKIKHPIPEKVMNIGTTIINENGDIVKDDRISIEDN